CAHTAAQQTTPADSEFLSRCRLSLHQLDLERNKAFDYRNKSFRTVGKHAAVGSHLHCHVACNCWDASRVRHAFRSQGQLDFPGRRNPERSGQPCCSETCNVLHCGDAHLVRDGSCMRRPVAVPRKPWTSHRTSAVRRYIDRYLPAAISEDPLHLFLAS